MERKKQDWRKFYKGDLVWVFGLARGGFFDFIPAFVYETQTMKDIVQIYCFGEFDEWSSSYLKDTCKVKGIDIKDWIERCEKDGYPVEYVIRKMKEFKVKPPVELIQYQNQPKSVKSG